MEKGHYGRWDLQMMVDCRWELRRGHVDVCHRRRSMKERVNQLNLLFYKVLFDFSRQESHHVEVAQVAGKKSRQMTRKMKSYQQQTSFPGIQNSIVRFTLVIPSLLNSSEFSGSCH